MPLRRLHDGRGELNAEQITGSKNSVYNDGFSLPVISNFWFYPLVDYFFLVPIEFMYPFGMSILLTAFLSINLSI